ncbi:hypothetical protein HanIR_Chr09g0395801 [Helianthus annuus]|nr:hypothetical protein HanIR_Chr09g0395801 [Helianthus annuus]
MVSRIMKLTLNADHQFAPSSVCICTHQLSALPVQPISITFSYKKKTYIYKTIRP